VDVIRVDAINADLLAPGTHAGRLTLYTESAIKRLKDEGLFLDAKESSRQADSTEQDAERPKAAPQAPTARPRMPAKAPASQAPEQPAAKKART
jgi:hypothetical protein